MLMADEAISNATEEIENKFKEMMKNENFDILDFYSRQKQLGEPSKGPIDVTASFGVLVKPGIADKTLVASNSGGGGGGGVEDSQAEAEAVAAEIAASIDQNEIRQLVRGVYETQYRPRWPTHLRGETELLSELRIRMRCRTYP